MSGRSFVYLLGPSFLIRVVAMMLSQQFVCVTKIPFVRRRGASALRSSSAWRRLSGGGDVRNSNDNDKNTTTAYVAVGSNLGDRHGNIMDALDRLRASDTVRVDHAHTSHLYETPPMYLTEQPAFLNGVVRLETSLSPRDLLDRLKDVERSCGRDVDGGVRNGPRPVDLDVLLYGPNASYVTNDDDDDRTLVVPHPRMAEREFVLRPLREVVAEEDATHPITGKTIEAMTTELLGDGAGEAVRVLPLPRGRTLRFDRVLVMGVLNTTPDSFSDGGKLQGSVEIATREALKMVEDGADIVDIGGESTRPGAKEVDVEEELRRTIPVIESIRRVSPDVVLSVDTRRAAVARAAIAAGADVVNDVSGGAFDPEILAVAAELRVPIVLTHSRGTPVTMSSLTEYENDDVVGSVGDALAAAVDDAGRAGVPRWSVSVDPGVGFAKNADQNLSLLRRLDEVRRRCGDAVVTLGPSRKRFIGALLDRETRPDERDFGTAAACVVALWENRNDRPTWRRGCSVVRVHNVAGVKQALAVMEAVRDAE